MASMSEHHVDYLPEPVPGAERDFEEQLRLAPQTKDEGLGSVFVNWIVLEEDRWTANWQCGDEGRSLDEVTKAEALAWARNQEASHYWIFSAAADDWVPLSQDHE
jgi:hypothetical protein